MITHIVYTDAQGQEPARDAELMGWLRQKLLACAEEETGESYQCTSINSKKSKLISVYSSFRNNSEPSPVYIGINVGDAIISREYQYT